MLLHELSHSVVAIRNGLKIKGIILFIFGGVAQIRGEPNNAWTEFKIAFAGPLCSFTLGIFFFIVERLCSFLHFHPAVTLVLSYLALINIILAVFNLVPGFPLDGGRLLRAFFWMRTQDFYHATRIATRSGKVVAFLLICFGAIQIVAGNVTGGIWFILIGLFLQFAAQGSYQQILIRENLRGFTIKDAMRSPVVAVTQDLLLDQLVTHYFLPYKYESFPVLSAGNVTGLISIGEVERIPKNRWPTTRVVDVMTTLAPNLILDPAEDAVDVFNKMAEAGREKLPVVKDGALVGIVTRKNILHLKKIKSWLSQHKQQQGQ